jgi:hypothetical protein
VAGLAEFIMAKDPAMLFLGTMTGSALGYWFRKPREMQEQGFHLADFLLPLAECFQERDAEASHRIFDAAFACFAHFMVRSGMEWDLPKAQQMCELVFCASPRTEPDETGLRLLGGESAHANVFAAPAAGDMAVVARARALARQCLRFACLQMRRRLLSPCAQCGRVPHAGAAGALTAAAVTTAAGISGAGPSASTAAAAAADGQGQGQERHQHSPLLFCKGRCRTAYCDMRCQTAHWFLGSHKDRCPFLDPPTGLHHHAPPLAGDVVAAAATCERVPTEEHAGLQEPGK